MSELAQSELAWPSVSVVMPVRNEARHLEAAVTAVLAQEYPGRLDLCLAVAPSTDSTDAVALRLAQEDQRVAVVSNPSGVTPAGLNCAIDATSGDIVVRVDGHARLSPGYIALAVRTLCRTGAVNVGGIQDPHGTTPFERAVAAAMTSWAGTGGSRFHVGGAEGPVDTVYLGVFRRAALARVGGFDESLVRNQDYELNIRLRAQGGIVWFDPALRVEYQPRSTWRALARQYFEYGWWKAEVIRRHPTSIKPRQLAPAALTAVLAVSMLVPRCRRRLPTAYFSAVGVVAVATRRLTADSRIRFGAVLPTMHLAWGIGFLSSMARLSGRRVRRA